MNNGIERRGNQRGLGARDARRVGREIGGLQGDGWLRETEAHFETDVTMTKISNFTMATGAGMQAVVHVTLAQQALEMQAPAASGRLAWLGDSHALGVADQLSHLRHRLFRI